MQNGLQPIRRCLATAASSSSPASVSLESIKAGLLLARNPIVTPDLTPLENAYFNYQEELERRLMWTFPHYYYFKKGSLAERRFFKAQRGPVSKQPGVFYSKGVPDIVHNRERRSKQEVVIPKDEYEESAMSDISRPVLPNSRVTKADEQGDLTSLERQLPRTLYLLVKDGKLGWKLPSFDVTEGTPLHRVAEDGLRQLGGDQINTWTVARSPTAVLKFDGCSLAPVDAQKKGLSREFIIKSNILSGAFKPQKVEYAWLTREEIEEKVSGEYFQATEFLFSRV
ncbi:CYFA0S06e02806g1_1 [Cyberlindnera fabianii]|uniref:Large ribosomal subunit protein mL46 n=1 Tax=Cyberlindnera fabianii TaxID=36022 RepID=A0A061AU46_CYBFA|nr:CYFA0S06e02806g1_1 [Cyberlindnera fabianii]